MTPLSFASIFFSSIGVSEEVLTRGSFCWGLGTAAVGLESSEKLQPSLADKLISTETQIQSLSWEMKRLTRLPKACSTRISGLAQWSSMESHPILGFHVTSRRPCWCTEPKWKKSFGIEILLLCKT